MNNRILDEILSIENFILEQDTGIDDMDVYIRPLYIELIALYPSLQKELAQELSEEIKQFSPELLFTIEAATLPIATLIANNLEIPLSIIRKPYNHKHEKDEPLLFFDNRFKDASAVLLDDAIWSGYTINYAFDLLEKHNIPLPQCYFIFDFLSFNKGGCHLNERYLAHLKDRTYWLSYRDIVERAYLNKLITNKTYKKTILLFNET